MARLFANSGDPDQLPFSAASDLDLHSLPINLLGISRLKWVKCLDLLQLTRNLVMDIMSLICVHRYILCLQ